MTNYWLFKVKDDSYRNITMKGIDIYKHRMQDKAWGLKTHSESGRRTANIDKLRRGDRVLFYLGGKDGHCFLGTCTLNSGFQNMIESAVHEDYLDWKQGVLIKDIEQWENPLPIEQLRGKVHLVPIKGNYGSYIQGSITGISAEDHKTVIYENRK
jgi:hypothetical protein